MQAYRRIARARAGGAWRSRAWCSSALAASVAVALAVSAPSGVAAVGERTVQIRAASSQPAGLFLMSRGVVGAGGSAVRLAPQVTGASSLSANGRYLVYEVGRSVRVGGDFVGSSSLRLHDFATGEDTFVVPGGHDPTFRPDGALVYLQQILRAGSHVVRYRPMERHSPLGPAVSLGPVLEPAGELVPAAGGRALVEIATSDSRSHIVVLHNGEAPTRVSLTGAQAGVVATSSDGRRALVWTVNAHTYALAIVRVADGRVVSQTDTGVARASNALPASPTGAWVDGHAVVAFDTKLVVASIAGASVRVDERLDLPGVATRLSHGHPVAVVPQWIRFHDAAGGTVVFAADLELPNLGGGVDLNLFTCRLRIARCARVQLGSAIGPLGGGAAVKGVASTALVAPISRAGASVLASSVEQKQPSVRPLLAFADARTGWIASTRGLYVTHRAGSTWARASVPGAPSQLDVLDAHHAWVVTSGRVYHTADGSHWQRDGPVQPLLQLRFLDETHGYALTATGSLLTTTDAGKRWTLVNSEGNRFSQVCLTSSGDGLAVERNEIVDTHDGGRSWGIAYTPPTPPRHTSHISISCDTRATFALDSFGEQGGHEAYELFATRDAGKHWYTSLQEPYFAQGQFPLYPAAANAPSVAPQAGPFVAIASNGLVIAGHCTSCNHERTALLTTTNGGRSWRPTPTPAFSSPTPNETDLSPRYVAALDNAEPLTLSFPDPRNGWVLLRRPDGTDRIAHTTDGGAGWSLEAPPPGA